MEAGVIWSARKFMNVSMHMNNRTFYATLLVTRRNFPALQFALFAVVRSIARSAARYRAKAFFIASVSRHMLSCAAIYIDNTYSSYICSWEEKTSH